MRAHNAQGHFLRHASGRAYSLRQCAAANLPQGWRRACATQLAAYGRVACGRTFPVVLSCPLLRASPWGLSRDIDREDTHSRNAWSNARWLLKATTCNAQVAEPT